MPDPLKQWAASKMGGGPQPPVAKGPPMAKPAPAAPPPAAAPAQKKTPDVRADQMTWLGADQQAELAGHEPDPPPSWIDPMAWETAKAQIGPEWNGLPEPRAAAAFLVHQTQQAAKAAAMAPPGPAPAPGMPPAGGAAPPHMPPAGGPPKPPGGPPRPFGGR